jgi:hypothetical protein
MLTIVQEPEQIVFRCRLKGVHYEHKWWSEKNDQIVADVAWPATNPEEALNATDMAVVTIGLA